MKCGLWPIVAKAEEAELDPKRSAVYAAYKRPCKNFFELHYKFRR